MDRKSPSQVIQENFKINKAKLIVCNAIAVRVTVVPSICVSRASRDVGVMDCTVNITYIKKMEKRLKV